MEQESIQYEPRSSCCRSSKKRWLWWVILVVVVIAVAAKATWRHSVKTSSLPDPNLYQVVLLANDQAFFGKLHNAWGRAPYLTDVYYLKPAQGGVDANGNALNSSGNYSVIKRGGELHKPTDSMYLNAENILYWENVGADSLVMKGIRAEKEYAATGKAPEGVQVVEPAPSAPATSATSTSPTAVTK